MTTARAKKTPAQIANSFDTVVRELKIPDPLPFNEEITLTCPSGRQLIAINEAFGENDVIELCKVIFREDFEKANEAFLDAPFVARNEWVQEYMKHFFGDADQGKSDSPAS